MHEQTLISLSDCWQILRRHKRKIWLATGLLSLLMGIAGLKQPVVYEANASFREKGEKGGSNSISKMLLESVRSDSQAATLMTSKFLNYRVIDQLGLQAKVEGRHEKEGFWTKAHRNWKVQKCYWDKAETPDFSKSEVSLSCTDVQYSGETTASYALRMKDHENYEVWVPSEKKWRTGQLRRPFLMENAQFTLHPGPKALRRKQKFQLTLLPKEKLAESLVKGLEIGSSKSDSALLLLKFQHADRHFAADYLNTLMTSYKEFLHEQNNNYAEEQAAYLRRKDNESYAQLIKTLNQCAEESSSGLSATGFPDTEKELEFLAKQQEDYQQRLLEIDLELDIIQRLLSQRMTDVQSYALRFDASGLLNTSTQWDALRQRRDILEKSIENRKAYAQEVSQDFCGIDLETADKLFIDYNRELHKIEGTLKQYGYVLEQVDNPQFALSSINTTVSDPILSGLLAQNSHLQLNLSDAPNRTGKEQQRIEDELYLQRKFLRSHVRDSQSLLSLQESVSQAKVHSLQKVMLDLMEQKIAVLEEHIKGYLRERRNTLSQETQILTKQTESIKSEMARLPERRAHEKLMELRLAQNEYLMQECTKLVEAQTIDHNLKVLLAGPVDTAHAPLKPENPRLLLWVLIGAIAGLGISSISLIINELVQGVPVSEEALRLAGHPLCGWLSDNLGAPLSNQDLETLRQVALAWKQRKRTDNSLALLTLGQGPDYSTQLAKLLIESGESVLIVPATFDTPQADDTRPGLLQALNGEVEVPHIVESEGFHRVLPGGCCRFAVEKLCGPKYVKLLDSWKKSYSCILLVAVSKPQSAVSASLGQLAAVTFYTVTDESRAQLDPVFRRQSDKEQFFLLS